MNLRACQKLVFYIGTCALLKKKKKGWDFNYFFPKSSIMLMSLCYSSTIALCSPSDLPGWCVTEDVVWPACHACGKERDIFTQSNKPFQVNGAMGNESLVLRWLETKILYHCINAILHREVSQLKALHSAPCSFPGCIFKKSNAATGIFESGRVTAGEKYN